MQTEIKITKNEFITENGLIWTVFFLFLFFLSFSQVFSKPHILCFTVKENYMHLWKWIKGKCIYFSAIVGDLAFTTLCEMLVLYIFYFVNDNEILDLHFQWFWFFVKLLKLPFSFIQVLIKINCQYSAVPSISIIYFLFDLQLWTFITELEWRTGHYDVFLVYKHLSNTKKGGKK